MTGSGTIEDQQLVVDEHGFGDHKTGAAGPSRATRRQQMQKQNGPIAHRTTYKIATLLRNAQAFGNSL